MAGSFSEVPGKELPSTRSQHQFQILPWNKAEGLHQSISHTISIMANHIHNQPGEKKYNPSVKLIQIIIVNFYFYVSNRLHFMCVIYKTFEYIFKRVHSLFLKRSGTWNIKLYAAVFCWGDFILC